MIEFFDTHAHMSDARFDEDRAEVLGMLARGRGAEYITEKLVISPHTAKAHTYNIYLKLDVHSRQELMDLVEDTVVPEEVIEEAARRLA